MGNTGVGKTFIVNHLCGVKDKFDSKDSATSVTSKIEAVSMKHEDTTYKIYNLPGLLEDDDDRIKANVKMLKEVLEKKEKVIIFYIVVTSSGRLRYEDKIAFKAFQKAYEIGSNALAFIVNKDDLKKEIQADVQIRLQEVLTDKPVHFMPSLKKSDFKEDSLIVVTLFQLVVKEMVPCIPKKLAEMSLNKDDLADLKKTMKKQEELFEQRIKDNRLLYENQILQIQLAHAKEQSNLKDQIIANRKAGCSLL